jgi:hypothetical protein
MLCPLNLWSEKRYCSPEDFRACLSKGRRAQLLNKEVVKVYLINELERAENL